MQARRYAGSPIPELRVLFEDPDGFRADATDHGSAPR